VPLCVNIIVVSASTLVHLVFGFGMEDAIALHPVEFLLPDFWLLFLFCGNLSFFALLVKSSASCPGQGTPGATSCVPFLPPNLCIKLFIMNYQKEICESPVCKEISQME
jgi:hypothetical protein